MRAQQSRGGTAATARLAVAITVAVGVAVVAGCGQEPTPGPTPEPPVEPWSWEMRHCVTYQPEAYVSPRHRVSVTVTTSGTVTEAYEPGWGAVAVEEIRAVVRTCGHYEYGEYGDPEGFREQLTVVETGFAGDESLLVEIVRLAPPEPMASSYAAVVRDGDVVVTVRTSGMDAAETMCLAGARHATCAGAQA